MPFICVTLSAKELLFTIVPNFDCITLQSSTFCRETDFKWGLEQGKSNKAAVTSSSQNLSKRNRARESHEIKSKREKERERVGGDSRA